MLDSRDSPVFGYSFPIDPVLLEVFFRPVPLVKAPVEIPLDPFAAVPVVIPLLVVDVLTEVGIVEVLLLLLILVEVLPLKLADSLALSLLLMLVLSDLESLTDVLVLVLSLILSDVLPL